MKINLLLVRWGGGGREAGKVHGIPPQGTKSPRISTFRKHTHIIEYMGEESPRSFVRSDTKIMKWYNGAKKHSCQ